MRMLFVCIENSCRSQMAEALARMAGVEAFSAGSRPSGSVHPGAVAAMAELGYDLSTHRSKSIDDLPDGEFDLVASMGCGDACPWVAARKRVEWEITDPKSMDAAGFARIRDSIRQHVEDAIAHLEAAP